MTISRDGYDRGFCGKVQTSLTIPSPCSSISLALRNWLIYAVLAGMLAMPSGRAQTQGDTVEKDAPLMWLTMPIGHFSHTHAVALARSYGEKSKTIPRAAPQQDLATLLGALAAGRGDIALVGIDALYALNGWHRALVSPRSLHLVLTRSDRAGFTLYGGTTDGKENLSLLQRSTRRVAVTGATSLLSDTVRALMRGAGLQDSDYQLVPFESAAESWRAIVDDEADLILLHTASPYLHVLKRAGKSVLPVPFPDLNAESQAEIRRIAPWISGFMPFTIDNPATISGDAVDAGGADSSDAALPVAPKAVGLKVFWPDLLVLAHSEMVGERLTAAIDFLVAKEDQGGGQSWALTSQPKEWSLPWHRQSIEYLNQAELWQPEDEASNQRNLQRQRVLRDSWMAMQTMPSDGLTAAEKLRRWISIRDSSLSAAGLAGGQQPGEQP